MRITLTASSITIVNDGAQQAPLPELRGLAALEQRVAADGGELTVEQDNGQFLTAANFPTAPQGNVTRTSHKYVTKQNLSSPKATTGENSREAAQ